jgi:hypothetical protein
MRNAGWGCDSPQIFRSRSLAKYIMTLYNQINQAPKYTIQRVKLVNAVAVILQPGGATCIYDRGLRCCHS